MTDLELKLGELVDKYHELEQRLSDPAVIADRAEYQNVTRQHKNLEGFVVKFAEWKKVTLQRDDSSLLMRDSDQEMAEMAKMEYDEAVARIEELEQEIQVLLLPRDPRDEKDVYLEIRAGTGGDEAALFAGDLLKMYMRYAERRGWKTEILSANETGLGGYKEVVARIKGDSVYSRLKYEGGVHRVQRVPETEAAGRIHTSAITVAVMPEADEVAIEVRECDLKIDTYHASGAGGQHVNTTDSAVRMTHLPTGVVVTCQDERSQIKNRVKAMQILKARLYDLEMRKHDEEESATRKSMVGSGDRSQKIRTYNYPENRLTDHRIGLRIHALDRILDGDLDPVVEPMILHVQTEQLKFSNVA